MADLSQITKVEWDIIKAKKIGHFSSGGFLRWSVVMGAPIRIFCLPFRNGLHGGCVEATACTVTAAVGYRGDSRSSLSRCSWHRQGFGGETLWVRPGKKTWYLNWIQARNGRLLKDRGWFLSLSNRCFIGGLSWNFRGDRTLQNLCSWHSVAWIRPATFL